SLKAAAKAARRKVRFPEQSLRLFFPDLRATLYAGRALLAGDPRFQAALDAIALVRREADDRVTEGQELFGFFNRIPVHSAAALPWKSIDRLAVDLMRAAEDLRRACLRSDESLPLIEANAEIALMRRTNSPSNVM